MKTLAKRRHRLISTPRLRLCIADLLLLALAALQTITDTLLCHRHLRLLHVLLLQLDLQLFLVITLQIVVRHDHELRRRDVSGHDTQTERCVGLAFQVGKERADLLLVGVGLAAEVLVGCVLDGDGSSEDSGDGFGGAVGEAVVDKTGALVTDLRARSVEINLVDVELALLRVAAVGSCAAGCFRSRGSWRCLGRERRGSGCGRSHLGALVALLSLDELLPLDDKLGCAASDLLIRVPAELSDEDTCLCCLNEAKKPKSAKDHHRIRRWDARVSRLFVRACTRQKAVGSMYNPPSDSASRILEL